MKITDVTSAPNSKPLEESPVQDQDDDKVLQNETVRKRTLLQRFEIPIEHLDYDYVRKCTDSRKIERILRILRSGEEGTYPDLERCVEARLETLNPNSRLLRVEKPALRTQQLDSVERAAIQNGLQEWLENVAPKSSSQSKLDTEIFTDDGQDETINALKDFPLPVRGSAAHTEVELNSKEFTPAKKSNRIKSWEYDKWDKYDVETELTKLDIADMQREEWEKRERPKVIQEQKQIERLMKSTNVDASDERKQETRTQMRTSKTSTIPDASVRSSPAQKINELQQSDSPKKRSSGVSVENPSYIEEVDDKDDDDEAGVTVNTYAFLKGKGIRKATVVIEDLNLSM